MIINILQLLIFYMYLQTKPKIIPKNSIRFYILAIWKTLRN